MSVDDLMEGKMDFSLISQSNVEMSHIPRTKSLNNSSVTALSLRKNKKD